MFREELSKQMIGAIVTLVFGINSVTTLALYKAIQKVRHPDESALIYFKQENQKLALENEFLDLADKFMTQSGNRTLIMKTFHFTKLANPSDIRTPDSWSLISYEGRLAATNELATLSRYSPENLKISQPLRNGIENLLRAEIFLWEKVHLLAQAKQRSVKTKAQNDKELDHLLSALLDYNYAFGSMKGLLLRSADNAKSEMAKSTAIHDAAINELHRNRDDFKLSLIGFTLSILLTCLLGMIAFAKHKNIKKSKKGSGP